MSENSTLEMSLVYFDEKMERKNYKEPKGLFVNKQTNMIERFN